jgi:uncharacterized protein with von Willebrand factor type A (vWA) domain
MADEAAESGNLLHNLLHFGRLLRSMGLKISTGQLSELARALTLVDIGNRADFYNVSRGLLVTDPQDFLRFDRAFELFWLGLQSWLLTLGQTRHLQQSDDGEDPIIAPDPIVAPGHEDGSTTEDDGDSGSELQDDSESSALYSPVEILRHKDFASFSDEEKRIVKRAMARLVWDLRVRQTRRLRRSARRTRYLDLRRSIRANTGNGGEIIRLAWRRRKTKPRPLVVICDISGSMDAYSRLFLHFIHALNHENRQVEAFAFGTRLTRLTPALRHNDVDAAVDKISDLVVDWSGGTRIGQSLKSFNYQWSRRVLGRGATMIIISDGWERGDLELLEREIDRLSRTVHRLIWLNPNAGAPGYQPLVGGIRTVLPYCDTFLPLHNLHSLEEFISSLAAARF